MFRASCSFVYARPDGSQGYVRHGDLLPADHEAVAHAPALFIDERPAAPEKATAPAAETAAAPKPRTRKA